jgi:hypothetical protein
MAKKLKKGKPLSKTVGVPLAAAYELYQEGPNEYIQNWNTIGGFEGETGWSGMGGGGYIYDPPVDETGDFDIVVCDGSNFFELGLCPNCEPPDQWGQCGPNWGVDPGDQGQEEWDAWDEGDPGWDYPWESWEEDPGWCADNGTVFDPNTGQCVPG